MSIIAYCGLPGSGKSYSVVKHQILPALKLGRKVVTNIPLQMDALRRDVQGGEVVELPMERIQQEPHLIDEYATAGCVLILDELWRLFPAGEKVNRVPESYRSLLAEHRHRVDAAGRSMQIVFVTQSVMQIGAFARQLIEQTIITTKLTDVGLSGRYRVDVYRGAVAVEKANVQNAIRQIQAQRYAPEVFRYYQSHTMSTNPDQGPVDEAGMDSRGSFLRRPLFIAGPVFVGLVLFFAVPFLWDLITGKRSLVADQSALPEVVQQTPLRAPASVANTVRTMSPARAERLPEYRLMGWIESEAGGIAMIEDNGRVVRIPLAACSPELVGERECQYRDHVVGSSGTLAAGP